MKRMTCEMCSSNDIIKTGDFYECQACGTKYSVESAKNLLVEIVDDSYEKELENCLALEKTKQFDKARIRYQELIERVPSRPEAYYYLIRVKSSQGLNVKKDYRIMEALLCDEDDDSENKKLLKSAKEIIILNEQVDKLQREAKNQEEECTDALSELRLRIVITIFFLIIAIVKLFRPVDNVFTDVIIYLIFASFFIAASIVSYLKYNKETKKSNLLNHKPKEITEHQRRKIEKDLGNLHKEMDLNNLKVVLYTLKTIIPNPCQV